MANVLHDSSESVAKKGIDNVPRTGMVSRRDRHVSVDLTPEQKDQLKRLADVSGLSVADYLRAVVATALRRKAKYQIDYSELTAN